MSLCQIHYCPQPCPLCEAHSIGPLVYELNVEQSEHFLHAMMNPKPPTEAMKAAAKRWREFKNRPGDLEYDSWASAFDEEATFSKEAWDALSTDIQHSEGKP